MLLPILYRNQRVKELHAWIALMTPEHVHYRLAKDVYRHRSEILSEAYEKYPNRFKGKIPVPKSLPKAAWINKPATEELEFNLLETVSQSH